jgi:hypothetical protein
MVGPTIAFPLSNRALVQSKRLKNGYFQLFFEDK